MKSKRNNREEYGHSDRKGQDMGITIAIGVVLVMIVVLSCFLLWQILHQDNSAGPVVNHTSQETFNDTLKETAPAKSEGDTKNSDSSGEAGSNGGANEDSNDLGVKFEEVSDIVTAKEETNLRSEPSTEKGKETVVVLLKNGETVERTGINKELGWSRLLYEGQVVYASTSLLVQVQEDGGEDENPEDPEGTESSAEEILLEQVVTQSGRVISFIPCDDVVLPKITVNLRLEPSADQGDASIKYQAEDDEELQRTGYDDATGWSRVEYKGEVLYVLTSLVEVLEEEAE